MTQVGRSSLNAPWIMPTSRLSTVTGAPESPGWPHTCMTMVPGSWPGPPGDAARVAGGAALLAGDLAERRVRADAVDHEAVEVGHRHHLGRIELDHRVVEVFVAGDHGAEHALAFGALGGDLRARAAAVRGGEADQVAAVVGADGGQRADRVAVDDDARTAAHRDPVVGGRRLAGKPGRTKSTATSAAAKHRCAVCKCVTPVSWPDVGAQLRQSK